MRPGGLLLGGPQVGGLSQTMLADLPLAQAAYTRSTGVEPPWPAWA